METPLISVILPTYNGALYIEFAIESVLNQKYENLELIIIDDASTDTTPLIIEKYRKWDSRILVSRNSVNKKLVASLNHGIQIAWWEYIARIDDDDIWIDPDKLSKQIQKFHENKKLWVVGTQGIIIDDDGKRTGWTIQHGTTIDATRREFWLKNGLIHTSIVAKKSVLIEACVYRKQWLYVEDFDLWLRILALGYDILNIPEYCIEYRVRSGSTTGKKYYKMQWLTFLRLFSEKSIYSTFWRKVYCLCIRFLLVIIPVSLIRFITQKNS